MDKREIKDIIIEEKIKKIVTKYIDEKADEIIASHIKYKRKEWSRRYDMSSLQNKNIV